MKGQNSNGQIFICGQTTDVRGTDGITPPFFLAFKSSLTPSIVPHAFHFMSMLLKDRRILLNTVVK
jgi:hypothetical protein